jgi:O-antigen/teichoic acid export membrane protein
MIRRIKNKLSSDKHFSDLIQGAGEFFSIRMLGLFFSYVFTLLIARKFGTEATGIFALSFTVLQMTTVLGRLGFESALIRFISEFSSQNMWNKVKEVYLKSVKTTVIFSLFLSVLLFFLSPYIAEFVFKKEYMSFYFRLVSFAIVPMVLLFLNSESLRGLKKIKEYIFLQNTLLYLISVVIVFILSIYSNQNSIPVIAIITSITIVSILSIFTWIKKSNILSFTSQNVIKLKDLLRIAIPLLMANSVALIAGWIDITLLGMLRTESEVGIYNVALKISKLTIIPLRSINSIAAPKFAEYYGKGDMRGLEITTQKSTKLIFWISFPILLACIFLPSHLLSIFGNEFQIGSTSLMLLALGMFVASSSGAVGWFLMMTGKHVVYRNIILLTSILQISLDVVLIKKLGIEGAAIASMATMITRNIISVIYIKMKYNILTLYIPVVSDIIRRK